jgi:hypothetical protein
MRRNARPVGHTCIGVRCEGATAFVVDEVMLETKRPHGIVEGQELEATHAEHRSDLMRLEHLGKDSAPGHPADVIRPVGLGG